MTALLILQLVSSAPPLPPAQAAAIMARVDSVANWTNRRLCVDCDGPRFASTGSRGPSAGPWEFPPPSPPRRLDGTLLTDPPAYWPPTVINVLPPWVGASPVLVAPFHGPHSAKGGAR